jgi:hypothetical protein
VSKEVRTTFSGHEGFPFRYTWPKKAVDAVRGNPEVFDCDDAMVQLGVGKNMVKSIRHWSLRFGLVEVEESAETRRRGRRLKVSTLGEDLLSNEGWDPYLEDPGTLWLLHWKLVSKPEAATTWWAAFNRYPGTQFTRQDLQDHVEVLMKRSGGKCPSMNTLKRDIDVFIRTYVPPRSTVVREDKVAYQDTLECPLVELGLLRESSGEEAYQIVRGYHETLPTKVFEYGLWEYLSRRRSQDGQAVTLEELALDSGAPGRVFCLNEVGLLNRLEEITKRNQGIQVDETAGLKQVYVRDTSITPKECLGRYFAQAS